MSFGEKLVALWYKSTLSLWLWPLLPLSLLMKAIVHYRYVHGRSPVKSLGGSASEIEVPIIIVGNITVGGTGKTPLVTAIIDHLKSAGWSPGIVSRGYGTRLKQFPAQVFPDSDPAVYGDEPVMLAQAVGVPLAIAPERPQAVELLHQSGLCNIIISDDGLQHYPLQRNIEIAVLDGQRGTGNGYCLPVGPLREPVARLQSVDLVVSKGTMQAVLPKEAGAVKPYVMTLVPCNVENVFTGDKLTLSEFAGKHRAIHGVAGIGNPASFFKTLQQAGLNVIEHRFQDHYPYQVKDFRFDDELPVMMTVKDAVKCRHLKSGISDDRQWWCLPVTGVLEHEFWKAFDLLLSERCTGPTANTGQGIFSCL